MLLYLLEGLALIVFDIRFLRKGLDRLFGSRLSSWLSTTTQNRWQAFGAGIATGTVAPSSTALSVLSLQMLHTGRLSPEKMLAVLLGGSVGMTVTAQILASGVTNQAGYLLIIGVIGFQILHREVYRGIGQCLLALGLIFLARYPQFALISRNFDDLGRCKSLGDREGLVGKGQKVSVGATYPLHGK